MAVWDGWRQGKVSKRVCGPLLRVTFAVPHLFLSFLGKVGEHLKRLNFSQHRKWNVELLTVPQQWNPPSLFLSSYMRPATHRQLVKRVSERPLWVLAGLSGSCLFLTVVLQMITTSPPRYYYPQDSLVLQQAKYLWDTSPKSFILCFLLSISGCTSSFHFYLLCFPVDPSSNSFSRNPPPSCLLKLNKQTNPLPLDTPLGRGDLLCLSGRILSDIVAPVNKRKAPEAGGASLFVHRVDYLPHTPFRLFSLCGV